LSDGRLRWDPGYTELLEAIKDPSTSATPSSPNGSATTSIRARTKPRGSRLKSNARQKWIRKARRQIGLTCGLALAQARGRLSQGLRRRTRGACTVSPHGLSSTTPRRPHQALANRTPMAVWREGIGGGSLDTAVDMTLRLDNAGALPTCPQPQQQQKQIAA